ncbi:hypothetical protein [Streptomyces sp. H27-C3]|uniref:hypothetical protein n=1 Tax=Streptomyces sp. H27-C3 TaxID=3046305 RepID=UPI0024B89E91|nr:hypothetical protein [Streptomyces sp. H27-C3]MDJ0461999.1 hypothetical protein [Streptomyces sp. H27-C3]
MTENVQARNLVRGDMFRLKDGRRVEIMTDPEPSVTGVIAVTLWQVDTDDRNFSFTLRGSTEYEVEPD